MKPSQPNPQAKEEARFLLGFKSKTGILYSLIAVGLLLCAISFFLPMCSYNPTVIDSLKKTVNIFSLSLLSIPALLLWVAALVLILLANVALTKGTWRTKFNRFMLYPILAFVFLALACILLGVACALYEIPEQEFWGLPIRLEAGFYLFVVGSMLACALCLLFALALMPVAKGQRTLADLALKKDAPAAAQPASTLTEKLNELTALREKGLITAEEYEEKREALLKAYQ